MNDRTRTIRETLEPGAVPALAHPEWRERWPWLVQGLTTAGSERGNDMALNGAGRAGAVLERWEALRSGLGVASVVHSCQVHGAAVRVHGPAGPGLRVCPPGDGHATREAGVLLTVTVADCVPAYLVAPEARAVALVHAGWRGTAAGVLEAAFAALGAQFGVLPGALHLHLGPSICSRCYEVGPEVHRALGTGDPLTPMPVDLAGVLATRAQAAGVAAGQITRSGWCTRCGEAGLFSHRGGDVERQLAYLAVASP
ncbi:MAG: laccase domain-containing protein [Longimicrobiales bacterium]|nr:laccase domain-containing protein [Longimicrobiales bacterium]